jgi:hypothetical protein
MSDYVSRIEELFDQQQAGESAENPAATQTVEIQPLRRPHQKAEPYPVNALGVKLAAAVSIVQ